MNPFDLILQRLVYEPLLLDQRQAFELFTGNYDVVESPTSTYVCFSKHL